jgi:hypothetical protein
LGQLGFNERKAPNALPCPICAHFGRSSVLEAAPETGRSFSSPIAFFRDLASSLTSASEP